MSTTRAWAQVIVRGRAATHEGVRIERARKIHEDRYPELLSGDRGRLVVLGTETGGRWAPEALTILRNLAEAKSRSSPELLRRSAQVVCYQRWIRMPPVAAQTALVETLPRPSSPHLTELDGHTPDLSDVRACPAWTGSAPRSAGCRPGDPGRAAARTAGARSG